ncbi:NAD-dependent epimerase/dehydratase family protein [Uliginosibacterium gangwonense]|uniref:NAD-dependent epimerase/dehydratase family protein n=1 Tax=Uliginosibacterium gangwonense TaxID=392736 RepID=UPI0003A89176|nr:NAD(P)-dependent oxidoreductase [Uliginosibacterium gangwonense]
MMKILVTGATSGLGRNAVEALLQRGIEAIALGRDRAVLDAIAQRGIKVCQADLAAVTLEEARALVRGMDAVWHCAALSSPWGAYQAFYEANVQASETLFQACAAEGVGRFVHISTPALYFDFNHRLNIREDFKPDRHVNHYAATKALAEQRLQSYAARAPDTHLCILRPRAIFGPHDRVLFPRLLKVIDPATGKLTLPRAGRTMLDLTYAANVVHAMWRATVADYPSGSVFNITNGEPIRVVDALELLLVRELQRPLYVNGLPYPLLATVAWGMEQAARVTGVEPRLTRYSLGALAFDMTLDITEAKSMLGYVPVVSLEQGIAHTARWLQEHHG